VVCGKQPEVKYYTVQRTGTATFGGGLRTARKKTRWAGLLAAIRGGRKKAASERGYLNHRKFFTAKGRRHIFSLHKRLNSAI